MRIKNQNSLIFWYLGFYYILFAIVAFFFWHRLYWVPEGGSSGLERDWGPFPTGMFFFSPLYIMGALLSFKISSLLDFNPHASIISQNHNSIQYKIPIICFFLLTGALVCVIPLLDSIYVVKSFGDDPLKLFLVTGYFLFLLFFSIILYLFDLFTVTQFPFLSKVMQSKAVQSVIFLLLLFLNFILFFLISTLFTFTSLDDFIAQDLFTSDLLLRLLSLPFLVVLASLEVLGYPTPLLPLFALLFLLASVQVIHSFFVSKRLHHSHY